MSSRIHNETNPAPPMEIAEMTVNASGGLYDGSFAFILQVIEAEAKCGRRGSCGITEHLYWGGRTNNAFLLRTNAAPSLGLYMSFIPLSSTYYGSYEFVFEISFPFTNHTATTPSLRSSAFQHLKYCPTASQSSGQSDAQLPLFPEDLPRGEEEVHQ